ncbi:MAG: M6 family metalloprotease domain-containing protein [Candidatus Hydrogenedentes bacterium]|nr:M6 family metalloprotease domain-containing protein [Candidatus Hydrogenedentota bacterium]
MNDWNDSYASRRQRHASLCLARMLCVYALAFAAAAYACVGRDGAVPVWGGSGPNGIMDGKITRAWKDARAKGLSVPPTPPIFGIHPTVIILIENAAGGAPFAYPNAALWAQRLQDISTYYGEVSHGQFRLEAAAETFGAANDGVIGPVTVSGLNFSTDIQIGQSLPLVVAAIQAANPYIDFAAYDTNLDGTLEADELHILVYQAGDESSYGSSQTPRAWSHMQWQTPILSGLAPGADSDGVHITSYCYAGSEFNHTMMASMGQMTHELGHDLGLPDLYDVDGAGSGGDWEGLGEHSLMALGSWGAAGGVFGASPVHMDGFCKSWLGWANETVVTVPGNRLATLNTANGGNEVLRINVPASPEYFLIENRQHTGFDAGLPGTRGGLVIYHCDGLILTDENVRLNNHVNNSPNDAGIRLIEADGDDALRTLANRGVDTDYYRRGNNVTLNALSNPSSDLKLGIASGLSITNVGPSQAAMTFVIGALSEDVNHSGGVDAVDVQLVINAALGLDIGGVNADLNLELSVDAVDVQLVINSALAGA